MRYDTKRRNELLDELATAFRRAQTGQGQMVLLAGEAGIGKTRLALEVARRRCDHHADGVRLVELGPIGDPASVPDAIAGALGEAGIVYADATVALPLLMKAVFEELDGRSG